MSAYILLDSGAEAENLLIHNSGQSGVEASGDSCRISAIRFTSGSWSTGCVRVTGSAAHVTDIEAPAPSYAIVSVDGVTDCYVAGVAITPDDGPDPG